MVSCKIGAMAALYTMCRCQLHLCAPRSGSSINYVGSFRDITTQKELDRMKDIFVSDVSHELRTPTTNISLYLELMEDATSTKQVEYLKVLKEQAHQLRKLVEDILDLSRLTMGKNRKIEFSAVDLNFVTQQVVAAHLPLADASRLNLNFEPCTGLAPVRGEENQLARLITNLVSNALRYTFTGQCTGANLNVRFTRLACGLKIRALVLTLKICLIYLRDSIEAGRSGKRGFMVPA